MAIERLSKIEAEEGLGSLRQALFSTAREGVEALARAGLFHAKGLSDANDLCWAMADAAIERLHDDPRAEPLREARALFSGLAWNHAAATHAIRDIRRVADASERGDFYARGRAIALHHERATMAALKDLLRAADPIAPKAEQIRAGAPGIMCALRFAHSRGVDAIVRAEGPKAAAEFTGDDA